MYNNILEAYEQVVAKTTDQTKMQIGEREIPEFSVTVTPFEKEDSNIKGLVCSYFDNSFIVNNVNIL